VGLHSGLRDAAATRSRAPRSRGPGHRGNHGIGAATALILAFHGAAVVVSYLRIPDPGESAGPEAYRRYRAMDAEHVLTAVAEKGGRAIALIDALRDGRARERNIVAKELTARLRRLGNARSQSRPARSRG